MPTPQIITISGTHFQMGYRHGRQVQPLRPHIIRAIDARFAQLERDGADPAFEAVVAKTEQVLHAVDADTVELIRGLAEGLNIEFSRLLRYNLVAFLRDILTTRRQLNKKSPGTPAEGCTTWAATGPATLNGLPILVKNRDYHLAHLPLQVVVRAEPAAGHRYTFVASAGSPGVFVAGFNEAGLAVADTHVSSTDVGPGLPTYALSMHVLEQHRTVRSALAYLQSMPRLGRNNLLLADATGDIALFEIGHHHSAVLEAGDSLLVNTNHFCSATMQPYFVDTEPDALQGNTFARYRTVTDVLAKNRGQIDVPLARQLMATHAGPLDSICRHPLPEADSSTISTMIFLPAQRQMLFAHGQPCKTSYSQIDYNFPA